MKVRILQLINNIYQDNVEDDEKKESFPCGTFCVLGYFDALDTVVYTVQSESKIHIWDNLGELLTKQKEGKSSRRNIICIIEEDKKDELFWDDNEVDLPFFFVTMIRINRKKLSSENLMEKIRCINEESKDTITYLSYDHSEIVVVRKTRKYAEGLNYVFSFRQKLPIFKMYTIFIVKEDMLSTYDNIVSTIVDEFVDCRLRCVVKDFEEAEKFYEKLHTKLEKRNNKRIDIRRYDTTGSVDWLLEIDNVLLSSILECYKMGEMLTHANPKFQVAFFNIESEIFLTKKSKGEEE